MSLIGSVDTLPLPDLFEVMAAAGKTGALHIRSEQGLGIVYFDGGKVCAGEAGHRSGPVEDREALVARIFDVCFELFRFKEASFEFEPEARPTWPAPESVEVPEVLAETSRRLAEWAEILLTVPSLDARPRLLPEAPPDGVILEPAQWRVVAAVDGRRRISALIRVLDSSDFEICGRLSELVKAGLLTLDAPDPAAQRAEIEDLVEPPAERRWATPARPSRLAAVLDGDHWGSDDDGPDELAIWDEQVLATGGAVRQQVVREITRERVRETAPETTPPASSEHDDEDPSGFASEAAPEEEPEILTPS